jgi:hypothetical protein
MRCGKKDSVLDGYIVATRAKRKYQQSNPDNNELVMQQ